MTRLGAAAELARVLADPTRPYRRRWEERGAAYRGREINQNSIAKVVAAHMVDLGVLDETEEADWPRQRKDWIRTRLAGTQLSRLELELFFDAFAVTEEDRMRVRAAYGDGSGATGMLELSRMTHEGKPLQDGYDVEEVVHEHRLGPAGELLAHRATHRIRALRDGIAEYLYLHAEETTGIDLLAGGTVTVPSRLVGDELWGVTIALDRELSAGEEARLEYEMVYTPDALPLRRVRWATTRPHQRVTMSVHFDRQRSPRRVHQATWARLADEEETTTARIELDEHCVARAHWSSVRAGLVGISWLF